MSTAACIGDPTDKMSMLLLRSGQLPCRSASGCEISRACCLGGPSDDQESSLHYVYDLGLPSQQCIMLNAPVHCSAGTMVQQQVHVPMTARKQMSCLQCYARRARHRSVTVSCALLEFLECRMRSTHEDFLRSSTLWLPFLQRGWPALHFQKPDILSWN